MVKALLISLIALIIFPAVTFAQTPEESHMMPASSGAVLQTSDYVLPYPGLLPDNLFYGLKTARDHIVGFLISDPLKKASFDLLQADKRLQAGVLLIQTEGNGKDALAEQTISKGQNYLSDSVTKIQEAKAQGKDITDMAKLISNATVKHEIVLSDLTTRVTNSEKTQFTALLTRVQGINRQIAHYVKK